MAPTSSYQRNWLPDNHSGMAVVSDPAKQATTTNHKRPASSSSASLIDSAYNSPSSTIESVHPPSTNQQNSSLRPKRLNNNNNSSSSQGRSSRTTTASLKEYGECYRRLAEGTSAVVMVVRKLGKDGRNEKLYAIKQFRKRSKNETEKEYMKKLTSEFCISSTFSHPNVVQTIDLVLDDRKRYCTVMEYCPGGDLFSCILAERMTEREKQCCFKQMMQGLAYLHSMGVAHRDMKPENLLLTADGQLKITDFGVSDVYRFPWEKQGRKSRGLVGSEPYIAPEAFEPKHEYWGELADVWSAGIVFYCLWSGGLIWHRANKKVDHAFQVYCRVYPTLSFEPFRIFPSQARRLLYRMLDPNPQTRISSSQVLEDPWVKSILVCHKGVDAAQYRHDHVSRTVKT